jgi:hypothetical protein
MRIVIVKCIAQHKNSRFYPLLYDLVHCRNIVSCDMVDLRLFGTDRIGNQSLNT